MHVVGRIIGATPLLSGPTIETVKQNWTGIPLINVPPENTAHLIKEFSPSLINLLTTGIPSSSL